MVRDAVILAAGMGTRLRGVVDDRPKGLIEMGGQPLVGRSIHLLRRAGVERVVLVAGFQAERYREFAAAQHNVDVLVNPAFDRTGSMASLDIALASLPGRPLLVLESDIIYESRALEIASASDPDATLISGPTAAGDEVWVCAPEGRLLAMSKTRAELPSAAGEFVGITRLSAQSAAAMRDVFHTFVAKHGHQRMDYETGALVEAERIHAIHTRLIDDLCWGEIDDERQFVRVE